MVLLCSRKFGKPHANRERCARRKTANGAENIILQALQFQ
jgi:hypothetical protein